MPNVRAEKGPGGMDPVSIAFLITAACNALVTAAVTDSWEDVRHKVASWFGRGKPDNKTLDRLAATHAELNSASPAELEPVRQAQAQQWAGRFKDLIADHPAAADELAGLVKEIQAIAANATGHSVAAGHDVTIKADRRGVAAGVIHGSVSTGPTKPGPASS
jgi:hypothetical protein